MYEQEYRLGFKAKLLELVKTNEMFEGALIVGGIGGKPKNGEKRPAGSDDVLTHVAMSVCIYDAARLAEAETVVRGTVVEWDSAYIQRVPESPEHIKLDTFFAPGMNATIHIEVTSSLKIKSGNFEILCDKTGNILKAAPVGEAIENKRYAENEGKVDTENCRYFQMFFALRHVEQRLVMGDLFAAELQLEEARREMFNMKMRLEGRNLRASFPNYGVLEPAFLEAAKKTFPAEISDAEITRAAQAVISVYDAYLADSEIPGDPAIKNLIYGIKLSR